jgi:hypothetical protein
MHELTSYSIRHLKLVIKDELAWPRQFLKTIIVFVMFH